jgi:hypothetical protein
MTRVLVILGCLLAACDVGSVVPGGNNPDGGGNGCVAMQSPPSPHLHATGGTSNPGQNCMAANCHNMAVPGAGATPWTYAGTLYTTAGGTTGAGGVTVRVKSGGTGTPVTAISDSDGNFYTNAAITFPATADVTSCPTVKPMTTQLQTGNGACSSTGCHVTGGNPGPMGLN